MKKINYLSCLLLVLLFTMCKENKEKVSESSAKVFFPLKETILTNDLKPYIEKMEFIEIPETPETMFSNISKMIIDKYGNMYTITHSSISVQKGGHIEITYDKLMALKSDGTLLRRISEKGRGHKEYLHIYDYCISEDGEELMILDNTKIMCYGIKDSTKFREIKNVPSFICAMAPAKDGGAFLFSGFSMGEIDPNKKEFLLKQVNKDGEIVGEYIPKKGFIPLSFSSITQVRENRYYLKAINGQYSVSEFVSDTIKAIYKIDFQEQSVPSNYFDDVANYRKYESAEYYKLPSDFKETKENLFFKAAISEANEANFVYSTSKNKGVNWISKQDDPHIQILASDDEYFYTTIFNHDIERYKSDNPDVHGALFRLIAETIIERGAIDSSNSNPLIVKIKFKI